MDVNFVQIFALILVVVFSIVAVLLSLRFTSFENWLVYAVSEAEKDLGGGTGKLKLRYVYDLAVKAFPTFAKIIPFSVFGALVDRALITMKNMIETNKAISDAIRKE